MAKREPGPDGILRAEELEARINNAVFETFRTGSGQFVLDWLKSITVSTALGPSAPDSELRHREGQRYLVGIIDQRIKLGTAQIRKVVET